MGDQVERVRELYSRWAEGDFRASPDLFADDLVLEPWSFEPRSAHRGLEEVGPRFHEYLADWIELRIEASDLLAGERGIVVTERRSGVDRRTGVDSLMRLYAVWTFEDDRVTRVRWETDRMKAYEAGAVNQQSAEWTEHYSAGAGLPFDDDELESRIVWIWGSPRTGSSWLLRQICHPAKLDRAKPLGFTIPPGATTELRAVPYDEFLISAHTAPLGGPPVPVGDSYMPVTLPGFAGDHAGYAFAERYVDVWAAELRRLILVRLAAVVDRARASGTPVIPSPLLVIKEVNGSHAATMVMKMFPRSRLLFLVRDGRDVIDSLIHAYRPGGWMSNHGPRIEASDERLAWVREASMKWAGNIDIVRSAFNAHRRDLRYELRYEDMRAETTAEITTLFEWLGLPTEPAYVAEVVAANKFESLPRKQRGAARLARAARPGLWRENLSEAEREVVSAVMGSRLEALGYEPC